MYVSDGKKRVLRREEEEGTDNETAERHGTEQHEGQDVGMREWAIPMMHAETPHEVMMKNRPPPDSARIPFPYAGPIGRRWIWQPSTRQHRHVIPEHTARVTAVRSALAAARTLQNPAPSLPRPPVHVWTLSKSVSEPRGRRV